MKLTKFAKVTVLGSALTIAVAGCHRRPTPLTVLPQERGALIGDQAASGPSPGGTLNQGQPINSEQIGKEGIPTSNNFNPADMNQDRATLAADTVHFDFDSSVVKSSEQSNVDSVAAALKANTDAKLLIEGNCDERGTEQYNLALGERRALALREALALDGIDPLRIRTISYGKDKPVDPGHNPSAWAKNRRGDFVLLTPK